MRVTSSEFISCSEVAGLFSHATRISSVASVGLLVHGARAYTITATQFKELLRTTVSQFRSPCRALGLLLDAINASVHAASVSYFSGACILK